VWLAAAIVIGVAAPAVQWMLHFNDLDRGFARVRAFAEGPPARGEVVLAKTWDFLGMRCIRLQRWREGAHALEQASRYSPSSRIFVQWAICEMRSGNHAAANALFERALEKNPDDYFAWHELAVTALALERFDQGRRAAREMFRLQPGDEDARLVLEEIARREQAESAAPR
jgi:cytochrome c-type biogenesis protein CcmH/NrfG